MGMKSPGTKGDGSGEMAKADMTLWPGLAFLCRAAGRNGGGWRMFGLLQVSGAQAICWPGLMPFDAAEEMRSPLNSPQERVLQGCRKSW
jgi:hypothetical protein